MMLCEPVEVIAQFMDLNYCVFVSNQLLSCENHLATDQVCHLRSRSYRNTQDRDIIYFYHINA